MHQLNKSRWISQNLLDSCKFLLVVLSRHLIPDNDNMAWDLAKPFRITQNLKETGKISRNLARSQKIWQDLKESCKILQYFVDLFQNIAFHSRSLRKIHGGPERTPDHWWWQRDIRSKHDHLVGDLQGENQLWKWPNSNANWISSASDCSPACSLGALFPYQRKTNLNCCQNANKLCTFKLPWGSNIFDYISR